MRGTKTQPIKGEIINNFTFLKETGRKRGYVMADFICHCGNIFNRDTASIYNGNAKSCGCLLGRCTIHGMTKTVEYKAWYQMNSRCTNEKNNSYPYYKSKNITVCERWREKKGKGFMNFIEDMGLKPSPKHSIERINNYKGYFKENCKWATDTEQNNNKGNNVVIEVDGKIMNLVAWSKQLNIRQDLLSYRVKNWPLELALTTPYVKGKRANNFKKQI